MPTARFATMDKTLERIPDREKYALRTGSALNRIMPLKGRYGFRLRQSIGGVLAAAVLAGCSSDAPPEGQIGHVEGNFGGVVSGEPRASLIGRDVLSAGGSAVDAAVAMYFALAVTYPDAGSLGGEGVCIVQKSDRKGGVEAIEFRPLLIRRGGRTIAVPGGVRAMYALQARYGRLQWARLIQPAEQLARFGHPVSRAFARPLAAAPETAFASPEMKKLFYKDGKRLTEGGTLEQVQLASVLAAIRFRGAGDFYTGDVARRIADGLSRNVGIPVTVGDIRNYRPVVGNHTLHLPAGTKATAALELWNGLASNPSASVGAAISPADGDSIGFAAIDNKSGAAACAVGAHDALKHGRIIGETGILQAGPRPAGLQYPGLVAILVNEPRSDIISALTAAGGSPGAEARALSTASRVIGGTSLTDAMAAAPALAGARTNMIHCPTGIDADPELCGYAVEPGSSGLAVGASF